MIDSAFETARALVPRLLSGGPTALADLLSILRAQPGLEHVRITFARRVMKSLVIDNVIERVPGASFGYRLTRKVPPAIDLVLMVAKDAGVSVWHVSGQWVLPLPEEVICAESPAALLMEMEGRSAKETA